ncbi:MAG: BREX system ATP-binding domain-containing protein [Pseudanabaenaceae cyanobacterium]
MELSTFQAIAIVESLRAGIPTRLSTRFVPNVRTTVVDSIQQDWQASQGLWPQGRVIWGAYGQGKTHLLTQVEHLALDQGFATSRIALSKGVSGARLDILYAKLVSSLRTPNSTQLGIQHLLYQQQSKRLVESPIQELDRYLHPLPALVLETLFHAEPEERELLYGGLAGESLPLAELRRIYKSSYRQTLPTFPERFQVKKHFGAYFGVMADTLRWLGFRGWVILLDELELVGRLGPNARAQAYLNLDWLLNWSQQQPYPIYTIGAAALTLENDVFENGRRDKYVLAHSEKLKLSDEERRRLQAFFDRITDKTQCKMLVSLPPEATEKVLRAVESIYRQAWPDTPPGEAWVKAQTVSGPLRTQIRALLEFLDIQRIYQSEAVVQGGSLVESSLAETKDFEEAVT